MNHEELRKANEAVGIEQHKIMFYDSLKHGQARSNNFNARKLNMSGRQFKKQLKAYRKSQKAKNLPSEI